MSSKKILAEGSVDQSARDCGRNFLGKDGLLGRDLDLERHGETGFLAVGRGALDGANLDGLVERGVDAGEELGGFVLLTSDDGGAELFFQTAQLGLDAVVLEVFALAVAHTAPG